MPEMINTSIATPKGLIEFQFEPLRINDNTIFAVYCNYDGKPNCIHLATNENAEFAIMEKHNCPYDFHELEHQLSRAIYHFHK